MGWGLALRMLPIYFKSYKQYLSRERRGLWFVSFHYYILFFFCFSIHNQNGSEAQVVDLLSIHYLVI